MNDWLTTLQRRLAAQTPVARVVVASVRGSAPRAPGACMLIGSAGADGSIGGGNLELKATDMARQMLLQPGGAASKLERFALGARLGQCCGGAVNLWFERFGAQDRDFVAAAIAARKRASAAAIATVLRNEGEPVRALFTREAMTHGTAAAGAIGAAAACAARAFLRENAPDGNALVVRIAGQQEILLERIDSRDAPLWLFGAGHVGKALVRVLAELPFRVTWVDPRADEFPEDIPDNVTVLHSAAPADEVPGAPASACFLVMTHSHDIDYDICRAILRRNDFAWAGLIGSETKATCFALRLAREDIPADRIARLVSPIGVGGIDSKLPAAIAVSVAAQLLQATQFANSCNAARDTSVKAGALA